MNSLLGLIWVLVVVTILALLVMLAMMGLPAVYCYVTASVVIAGGCWLAVLKDAFRGQPPQHNRNQY